MKKILIVEDDKDIRINLQILLESEGYEVETAENGRTALDYLASSPKPSLILLDLMMPIMDGFEFRKIQEADSKIGDIPVLIMTAGGQLEEKCRATHAKAGIKKPIDIDELLEKISQYQQA